MCPGVPGPTPAPTPAPTVCSCDNWVGGGCSKTCGAGTELQSRFCNSACPANTLETRYANCNLGVSIYEMYTLSPGLDIFAEQLRNPHLCLKLDRLPGLTIRYWVREQSIRRKFICVHDDDASKFIP